MRSEAGGINRSHWNAKSRATLAERACLRQAQPFGMTAILRRSEVRLAELRPKLPRYYAMHPGAALRRLASTVRFGFVNCYITIAWQRCT